MENEMPEFITGYQEYKQSLFEKLMPVLDDYMLATLKLQHLRAKNLDYAHDQEMALLAIIGQSTEQIQEILKT